MGLIPKRRLLPLSLALAAVCLASLFAAPTHGSERFPNVLVVVVDTLRADRLSGYGYDKPTSPEIDALLDQGARFLEARTTEPLTGPSVASMLTSLYPHEHGASRNGLRVVPGLPSMPKRLQRRGYRTAAFMGNWTLKDRLTGLGEHFEAYREIFSRRRWLGLFTQEATAQDLSEQSLSWIDEHERDHPHRPFFVWIQYVEPHAPYRAQKEFAPRMGYPLNGMDRGQRYDTEIAFVDREIGRLLDQLDARGLRDDTLIILASDHGESLGDHGYWGHGRHLYEASLRVPLAFVWPKRIPKGRSVASPATLLDLAPTVLGLLGLPGEESFRGFDWSPLLTGDAAPPENRVTLFQAHKGVALGQGQKNQKRREGLLEVGLVRQGRKEILSVANGRRYLFDLETDPNELTNLLSAPRTEASEELAAWLEWVRKGLEEGSGQEVPELDDAAIEKLRALGYID